MHYALICTDKKPDGYSLRMANRQDHLDFLANLGDKLAFAGPFMDKDGETPMGSLVVVEAESLEEAQNIAAQDPYAQAGVFESVDIRAWKWLLGRPEEN